MNTRATTVVATLLALSLLASARAESLSSKLKDMVAVPGGNSKATNGGQSAAAKPAAQSERQALHAEANDAANRALDSARGHHTEEVGQ